MQSIQSLLVVKAEASIVQRLTTGSPELLSADIIPSDESSVQLGNQEAPHQLKTTSRQCTNKTAGAGAATACLSCH